MTICLPGYLKCIGAQYLRVLTVKNSGFPKLWILKMSGYSNLWVPKIVGPQSL